MDIRPHEYTTKEKQAMDHEFWRHEHARERMVKRCHQTGHKVCLARKQRRGIRLLLVMIVVPILCA